MMRPISSTRLNANTLKMAGSKRPRYRMDDNDEEEEQDERRKRLVRD